MPFGSLQLRPGINTVATPTLNNGGYSASNLIRWRGGLPEKVGGWQKLVSNAMGSITRCLHAWQDLNQTKWLAAGNLSSVLVMLGGSLANITPQTKTSSCALNLTTTKGSATVAIVDTNISTLTQYDSVFFNTPISIGGIILAGSYQILPTPAGTGYSITAQAPATSAVANGGAVPAFTTTSGSSTVSVLLNNHGLSDGDKFTFPISTTVGGVTILGTYSSISVTDANNFRIPASSVASSGTTASMNGGSAQYYYNITVGPAVTVGTGTIPSIGQYAIGQATSDTQSISTQQGTPITAADWTMDHWGEILLACPKNGSIWYWAPTSGFSTMLPVGNGPEFNGGIFVSMPYQILVAWGSTSTLRSANTDAARDPLIVRWSDQLNFLEWRATSRTQAGSYHIPTGSEIRGGIQGPQQAYIFTDLDCWAMQYIGPPLIFGFNQIGTGCGLVGAHAVANLYGRTYWMNSSNFFVTTGQGVQEVPCTIWDNVFQDLDRNNMSKCVAVPVSAFNEIWFFYPSVSGGTGECDKYAKVDTGSGEWDYGTLARSAGIDESVLGYPIMADPTTTYLQQHETGYDDDGSIMDSFFETGYIAYGDGENFSTLDYFEPDMKWKTVNGSSNAQVQITFTTAPSPNGPEMTSGAITVSSTTYYISPRVRGRQVKFKMETTDLGSWWRLGANRYRYTIDGRR